ncbi:MAG TPA: hypothetical protein P5088_03600, partial [Tenuifilum sp.]|nr:hypothetical protein [Tenuifilum sp.]
KKSMKLKNSAREQAREPLCGIIIPYIIETKLIIQKIDNNRSMKKIISIISFIVLFSCKEKKEYQLQIIVKNKTNHTLTFKLFPKQEYMSGELYDFSEIGSGHRNTEFQLEANAEMELFIVDELNVEPHTLTQKVFDSIYVTSIYNHHLIKFSPQSVYGYSENLYTENSNWTLEHRNYDLPTNFQKSHVESSDYIFCVFEDKFIK